MKFSCNTKILSDAVSNVMKAVSSRSTLPVLEGILIESYENELTLTGYDLEIGITTNIKAEVSENGKIVIPASYFSSIIKKMPGETVTISADEKEKISIESGNSSFQILGIDATEYPELPSISDGDSFNIEAGVLKNMIDMTLYAVATVDTRPVQTGGLFDIENGIFKLVAVDGFRLAIRQEKIEKSDLSCKFVVPGKSLSEVARLTDNQLFADDTVSIHFFGSHVVFNIDNYRIVTRILEGEFLHYENSIPKDSTTKVVLNTKEMIESIERTSLLITERLKSPLRLEFTGDTLSISCVTSVGRSYDEMACQVEGDNVMMGFNHRYLLDAFKNCGEETVNFETGGSLSPVKITGTKKDNFIFIVLPLRLRNEDN